MAKKTASKSAPKKAADKVDKKTVKNVVAKKSTPIAAKKTATKAPAKVTKAAKPSLAEKFVAKAGKFVAKAEKTVAKAGKVVAQVEKAINGKPKPVKLEAQPKITPTNAVSAMKAKMAPTKEVIQNKEKSLDVKAKTNEKPMKIADKASIQTAKSNLNKDKAADGPKMMSKSVAGPIKSAEKSSDDAPKIKIDRQAMSEDEIRWAEFYNKHRSETPPEYNIREQYESKKPIMHKTFGWGYILSNEYDRLEVLFKDGKRMLISNRKV